MVRSIVQSSFMFAFMAAAAHAQSTCSEIHFAAGQSATTIRGIAPPDDGVCYTFASTPGQTAKLKVSGPNMIISVTGIGDGRDFWSFKTRLPVTKFIVGQLMRSVTPQPYTVSLSLQ